MQGEQPRVAVSRVWRDRLGMPLIIGGPMLLLLRYVSYVFGVFGFNRCPPRCRAADFAGQALLGSVWAGADLQSARFADANLAGADFQGADLYFANFQRAADLSYADLTNANLQGADLTGANLTGAILDGANLTQVVGLPSN